MLNIKAWLLFESGKCGSYFSHLLSLNNGKKFVSCFFFFLKLTFSSVESDNADLPGSEVYA